MSQQHSQPGMGHSSLRPGVSGESVNAPYGPKAVDTCGIDSVLGGEYEMFEKNHAPHSFKVGRTSGPAEGHFDPSSLKPEGGEE